MTAFLLLVVLILLPYGFAATTGVPAPESSGLAAIHSAAESTYCEGGWTAVTLLLLAELGIVAGLVVGAHAMGGRGGALGAALREHGWVVAGVLFLVSVPFIIGWQTDSSVCERGKSFFWQSIFIDVYILAILAISYNLLFGFSGIVSFGHAAFFGMGANTVGLLMLHLSWPWWLATLAALLVGLLIALIKGGVGLRIKGLYFALFTLAFAEILFILAGNRILVDITGAENGFTFAVPGFLNMTQNRLLFYYISLVMLLLSYLLVRRLMGSPIGRVLRAIRDNEERAQMLGYNTLRFKLIAIALAGVMASGAGVLRGFSLKGASPNVLGLDFTMTPLLMTIIGGQGTFLGPVTGAFLLRLLEQALRDTVLTVGGFELNIGERWALMLGLVFIVIVIVFPYGIVGTLQARWQQRRARQALPAPPVEGAGEPLAETEAAAEGG